MTWCNNTTIGFYIIIFIMVVIIFFIIKTAGDVFDWWQK